MKSSSDLKTGKKYTFSSDPTQLVYIGGCDISDQYHFGTLSEPDVVHVTLEESDVALVQSISDSIKMSATSEIKQVNVCRFLAEALSEQLGTFTEDCDCDPELIEGVVETSQLDFDSLLEHLNENGFDENSDSVEAINNFKKATEGEVEVFAYWEA